VKELLRKYWFAILFFSLVVISQFLTPNSRDKGSSFSRTPDGYGAWYADLKKHGIAVKRWQRPLKDLKGTGQTLVIVAAIAPLDFSDALQTWIKAGNTLILLQSQGSVSDAEFSSRIDQVLVETARRHTSNKVWADTVLSDCLKNDELSTCLGKLVLGSKTLLADKYGDIVWEYPYEQGRVIETTTAFLGANAYQDIPGNYAFLTKLATSQGQTVLFDEYSHGYIDAEVAKQEKRYENWWNYFLTTPPFVALIQLGVIVLVLIWGENQRFGAAQLLPVDKQENSEAYIQALAGVLQKARSSEFVLEVLGRAEQLHIQQALGLGNTPVERGLLLSTWSALTQQPASVLSAVIDPPERKQRITQPELSTWLKNVEIVRRYLPTS
jgi:Domain of unknown function (DUF4350)